MQISKITLAICALALGITLAVRAEDTPAQAAARAALAAKMSELSEQPPTANSSKRVQGSGMSPVTNENGDTPAQAKAREALDREMMMNPPPSQPAPSSAPPAPKPGSKPTPTPESKPAPKPAPGVASLPVPSNVQPAPPSNQGPPLPISQTKEQKLQELLEKYEANQITPEEYHIQRAAIISGQ